MSWIFTSLYSLVAGVDKEEEEKCQLARELEAETIKKNFLNSITCTDHEFVFEKKCANVLYTIVEREDWENEHGNFYGQRNGKTRVYLELPKFPYLRAAFMENITHAVVEFAGERISKRENDEDGEAPYWFVHAPAKASNQRKIEGTSAHGASIVDDRFCIVAFVIDDTIARDLFADISECTTDTPQRLFSNRDYTLEFTPKCNFRLHLNKPINKSTQCWCLLPQPELPVRQEFESNLCVVEAKTTQLVLQENAKKLGWSQKRIEQIKLK